MHISSSSGIVRIAIAGCGGISYAHLKGYKLLYEKGIRNFKITATCDVDIERAKRMASEAEGFQQHKPEVYTDFEKLAKDQIADAVDICSSVSAHHQLALIALENGMHATVEKPFAITVKAGLKMVQLAQEKGLAMAISENARFGKGVRASRWILEQGIIGTQQLMVTGSTGAQVWYPDKVVANTPWRHNKKIAGAGAVLDLGSHAFDLIRFLCGELEEAYGVTRVLLPYRIQRNQAGEIVQKVPSDVDDVAFAILKFKSGAIGMYATGWGGHGEPTGFQNGFCVQGSLGSLKNATGQGEVYLDDGTRFSVPEKYQREASPAEKERRFPLGIEDTFALELNEFISAIQEKRKPDNNGWEGLSDIAVSYAIVESSLLNRPVNMAEVLSGEVEEYQRELNDLYGIQ